MYSYEYRIPFSMVDGTNEITLPAIMTLFQDVAIFHSTDLGVSAEVLKKHNLAWVVVAWQVEIIRKPKAYETVVVATAPTSFRGIVAERNLWITDLEGNYLVKANSSWCLMNFETRSLAKITDEIASKYETSPKMDMNYKQRNLPLPKEGAEELAPIFVDDSLIDFMGHVNNVNYIRMALRNIPEIKYPDNIRVEYKNQAMPGDTIYPFKWVLEDKILVSLKSAEGSIFATICIDK